MSTSSSAINARMLRMRLPRVCVTIIGKTAAEMIEKAEQVARDDNSFIEFRLDYLSEPASLLPKLKGFFEYNPHMILIATCRRKKTGGLFRGSIASEVDILTRAASAGCQLVDVELDTASKLKDRDWDKLRKHGAAILLSHHDFRATKNLEKVYAKMSQYPADFFKIVTTAKELYDNVEMMKFLATKSDERPMIGVCMGEQGLISRLLSLRAGSIFTFGAANPGEETAPGQIAARRLHETYRIDQIDISTRVYGVAGDPVGHSLSPAMMNTAFRRENLNAVYLGLHAKTMKDLMHCVREIPIHGLSITMPYKESVMRHLDKSDPLSTKIGACNTVIRSQEGKLYGFNTDVAGVLRPLEQRMPIQNAKVLVMGAGGAARAAVFGLKERGAEVYVLNRTAAKGQQLARQAHAKFLQRGNLSKLYAKGWVWDCIINATPVGMDNAEDKTAGSEKPLLTDKELVTRYVFEMVYSPAETKLTKMARARGIHVIPGIEMFVHQGARQFEIWTGKPAPIEEMHKVVLHALEQRTAQAAADKNNKKKR
ncbi:MAG: shikimate dehydrogenase [Acidobacteriales bacterium]|nr:shikimate dehydrogenase [Terriglobales bacterium]